MLLDADPHCYDAFGLRLHTRYRLPALEVVADGLGRGDVTIDFEPAIGEGSSAVTDGRRRRWTRDGSGASLCFEDSAGYELRLRYDSSASRIDVRFNRAEEDISGILLGIGMGALFGLRGVPVLHATTLAWGGGAWAMAGHAGAGKSSFAAALNSIGLPFLCDDLTPLRFEDGEPWVQPGGRGIRLCPDTAEEAPRLFGASAGRLGTDAKRLLDCRDSSGGIHSTPAPLAGIFILSGRIAGLDRPRVDRLAAPPACVALTRFVYGSEWLEIPRREVLELCGRLASRVPVYRVSLPDGLDRLTDSAIWCRNWFGLA